MTRDLWTTAAKTAARGRDGARASDRPPPVSARYRANAARVKLRLSIWGVLIRAETGQDFNKKKGKRKGKEKGKK